MAWANIRCPKCGEILPDFVDSCYTCDEDMIQFGVGLDLEMLWMFVKNVDINGNCK